MPTKEEVRKKWTEGIKRRRTWDIEAYKNLTMLMGEHYITIDPLTRKLYKPEELDEKSQISIPLVLPIWRTELSNIVRGKPIIEVTHTTDEPSDRTAAMLAKRILDSEMQRLGWQDLILWLWTWVSSTGLAYLHVQWNEATKNVDIEVVPNFECVIDPAVRRSSTEGLWAIHGRVMSQEHAYELFEKEFPEDTSSLPEVWRSILAGGPSAGITPAKGVLVLRLWHKPSRKYPDGAIMTIVGEEIVEGAEDPKDKEFMPFSYEHKQLPFIDFHHIRMPGRFDSQAMIQNLWDSQRDYDQTRRRLADARNLHAMPKFLLPIGVMPDMGDKMTADGGEILPWTGGPYEPKWLAPPILPPHIFQSSEAALREMQDISGSYEPEIFASANRLPAATAQILSQMATAKLVPIVIGLEQGIARVGRQMISLAQQYWDENRIVQAWSEDENRLVVDYFRKANLKGEYDVKVIPGSALPRSEEAKWDKAVMLWQNRLIQDPEFILKRAASDMPEVQSLLQKGDPQAKLAQRENLRAMEGKFRPAERWHDHDVHITELNRWRATEEFEEQPDAVRKWAASHFEEHEALKQEKFQEEMMKQMQMQGTQSGAGPEGEPAPEESPIPSIGEGTAGMFGEMG
jgi:hypothetical protein